MNDPHDPLEELLQPPMSPNPVDLRERLRARTTRHVRRRLWVRRLSLGGALAASLLLIAGILYVVWPPRAPLDIPDTPMVVAPPIRAEVPQAVVSLEVSPVALEWQAFDSKENRAAVYFQAGNQYLATTQDFESALRCYSQALDACSDQELEITPDDTWLLMTLKNARRKETVHD
jgi:hypothetical protein